MVGYIGSNARKRRRRLFAYPLFFILIFLLFYFFYYDNSFDIQKKDKTDNVLINSNNEVITYQDNYSVDEYELKIFQKDQQIISLNKRIQSQKNIIDEIIQEKNALIKNNQGFIKEINSLNIKKEQEFIYNENVINEKIKNLTNSVIKLENEKLTIMQEYKKVANQNLKFNLLVKTLEEKVNELENIIHRNKITISEQENKIKKLKDTSHHLN